MNARIVVVVALFAAACGGPPPVEGWQVKLVPTSECTLTGTAARDCEDETLLAQQSVTGRWIFERSNDGTDLTITTHEGRTLAGLLFNNDATVIAAEGCNGEGGTCAFTRRRFSSTDPNNLNCTRFGELIALGHFDPDDDNHFVGVFSDTNGNDENCGTPTINEVVFSVDATRADEAVLARTTELP